MTRFLAACLLLLTAVPALAKTHKDLFQMPCTDLWPAVKDTLRNSGKYGIVSIVNEEMTASSIIGGTLTGKRINTVLLNSHGSGCEMQVQTAYSGFVNNDAGDFTKRVDESLAKLKATTSTSSGNTPAPSSPPAGTSH